MYPIESVAYLSAAFIPLIFRCGCHPWLHLYTKLDLLIGAQIAHDGFNAPGGGSYFHQIHHEHFECNYGGAPFPLDYWFGTFEDGRRFARAETPPGSNRSLSLEGVRSPELPLLAEEKGGASSIQPISMEEVWRHRTSDDLWIVLHGAVLNVTDFQNDHPGGGKVLLANAGKDVTTIFETIHRNSGGFALVERFAPKAQIGFVPRLTAPLGLTEDAVALGHCWAVLRESFAHVVLNVCFVGIYGSVWWLLMGRW